MDARLYDLNKGIMGQMKAFDDEVAKEIVRGYFMELYQQDRLSENYMLLAAEERDFTVFRFKDNNIDFCKMSSEILEVLSTRGVLKDVSRNDDGTIDIWVNDVFYKLFDYDWGVIEI